MDVFGTVVNGILVVITLGVIWYARETVKESRKATKAAQETVAAVKTLLTVARDTAASSEAAAEAARQTVQTAGEVVTYTRSTVEVAKAAHDADERDRRLRQLRDIGGLVEDILWQAINQGPVWAGRCKEQNELAHALVGAEPPLPKCSAVVSASEAGPVIAAAREAREEVAAALNETRAAGNAAAPPPS